MKPAGDQPHSRQPSSRATPAGCPDSGCSGALTLLPLPDQLLDRARQSRLEVDQFAQVGVTTIRTMPS